MNSTHAEHQAPNAAIHSLAHRLKQTIDEKGAYEEALGHMSAGYAAGAGCPQQHAKAAIRDAFATNIGKTPYEFLQAQRAELAELQVQEAIAAKEDAER